MIFGDSGRAGYYGDFSYYYGGLVLDGYDLVRNGGGTILATITDSGFTVYSGNPSDTHRNYIADNLHYYIAFK